MTPLRSASAAAQDPRLVQTAVKGPTADSQDAVFLPLEHDAALEFRWEYAGEDFWCGTVNGCGRQLFTRIGGDKIPHFFHRGEGEEQCLRKQRNRGRLDIEVPIVCAEVGHWRESRGLPQAKAAFFDPLDRHDARYIHISGPPGTRQARIVLGDVTITSVKEDAASLWGREWDWFLHERNTELRRILNEQGISHARIKFTPTKHSANLQVFLATPDNVGDWGRIGRYEPAPNRVPRPPQPAQPVTARPRPIPTQAAAPQRTASSGPVRDKVDPYARMGLETHTPWLRGLDGRPTRQPASARRSLRAHVSEPTQRPAPAARVPAALSEEQIADELKDAIASLEEALALGDRKNKARCARRLHALRRANRKSLSSDDNRAIKTLLKQASAS